MEENINIDQSVLAKDVAEKISYEFMDHFLVKPLDPIKVTKEFIRPVSENKPVKDENGIEAIDYDKTETEVQEVDSDFRKGIVLKVPFSYTRTSEAGSRNMEINVGDVIVFRERAGIYFDLLKDSRLVRYYDIMAVEK